MANLRLLAALAHPDDETLGLGGTLARYADEGVETYLVTATRGEKGWFGDPASSACAIRRFWTTSMASSTKRTQ